MPGLLTAHARSTTRLAAFRLNETDVAETLAERGSNGPVERLVNPSKTIGRSMYVRAAWEHLRARIRHAG